MNPVTADYLAAADRALIQARGNLAIEFPDQAARLAYYAQFHAAQALIFERTGKVAKTHRGVQAAFHKLAKAEVGVDPALPRSLSNSYRDKEIADYEAGKAVAITSRDAAEAIAAAEHFIVVVRRVISEPPAPPER